MDGPCSASPYKNSPVRLVYIIDACATFCSTNENIQYINIQKKDHLDASPQLPCLWILKPQELNKRIICKMLLNMENLGKINDMVSNYTEADHKNFIDFFTKAISKKGTDKFEDEVINVYLESPRHDDKKMNYIYNLAYFE